MTTRASSAGSAALSFAVVAIVIAPLAGCASYRPKPLEGSYGAGELAPPPSAELVVAAAALKSPGLAPMTIDFDDGLSPEEAGVVAVLANPELEAARAERGLAAAALIRAGVLPDPQISLSIDRPSGGPAGTVTGAAVGAGWDIDALIARSARAHSARAAAREIDLEIGWREWVVAQAARTKAYDVLHIEQQLVKAREEEGQLEDVYRTLDLAARQKLVTDVERSAAADAMFSARSQRLSLELEGDRALLDLKRLLGMAPHATLEIRREPSRTVPLLDAKVEGTLDLDTLLEGLERRRLDLAALRLGYESQEAAVRAAVLRQFPRISIGFNRSRDTAALITFGPAISVTLPSLDRNRGEIASARATRELLREEYRARVFTARADIADLLVTIVDTRDRLDNAEKALPEARRLVEVYGEALRDRLADAVTYYRARVDLITKELAVISLGQQLDQLAIALEIASGRYGAFTTDS